jgi:hypothetical protein
MAAQSAEQNAVQHGQCKLHMVRTAAVAVVNHGTLAQPDCKHMTAMLHCDCTANDLAVCCCSPTARIKAMTICYNCRMNTACRTLHTIEEVLLCHNSKPEQEVVYCHVPAAQQIATHAGTLGMCHSKTAPAEPGKQRTPLVAAEHTQQQ